MLIYSFLFRSQKKKAKKQKLKEAERLKNLRELSIQTDTCDDNCENCSDRDQELSRINEELSHYQNEKKRITQLFGSESDVFQSVENVLQEASVKESELKKLKEENVNLAENVAVQLR